MLHSLARRSSKRRITCWRAPWCRPLSIAACRCRCRRDVHETMGSGIHGVIDGKTISAGSRDLIYAHREPEDWALRVIRRASWRSALVVFVAVEGRTIGALLLADELRAETPHAIRMLRAARIGRIVMVTGDHAAAAQTIGAALDLDAVLADRVPSDKVDAVRSEQRLFPTTMVGDGINDAPALAVANVGIAMGAHGASASSEAADVVIIADRLDRVAEAVAIAQRAAHRARKHRGRHESIRLRHGGGDVRPYRAGAGGTDSGTDRRRRHSQRLAGLAPGRAPPLSRPSGRHRPAIAA